MATAVSSVDAQGRLTSGSKMMASNFETFLTLLTTQMKNQDPLSPLDSNEFTAQLTQMAGVEQQLLTNDLLTSLVQGQTGLSNASNYIGKEITAAWTAASFEDGSASWKYELASDAAKARLQVLDKNGSVVWDGDAPETTAGLHDFKWDGKLKDGTTASEGEVFTLKVSATSAANTAIGAQALTQGRVTGVEMYDGAPYLVIGKSIVPLSTVISLNEPAAPPSANNS